MLLLETLYCNVNFFFHPLGIPLLTVPRHLDFKHNPCLKHTQMHNTTQNLITQNLINPVQNQAQQDFEFHNKFF